MSHPDHLKERAEQLYQAGYNIAEVVERLLAEGLEVSERTVRDWRKTWGFAVRMPRIAAVEGMIAELNGRMMQAKVPQLADRRKMETLLAERETLLKAQEKGALVTLKEKAQANKPKAKRAKNDFTGVTLDPNLAPKIYPHQKEFFEDQSEAAFWLKGRRLGFTYIVAWRSLLRLVFEGVNQIFISASQNQAYIIRGFIKSLSRSVFGVELGTGDQITVKTAKGTDATFYFLGTNAATAQGYGGDLIIDECAWVARLKEILETAAPMMAEVGYRLTLISTASYKSHYAYAIWEGAKSEEGPPLFPSMKRRRVKASEAVKQGYNRIKWEKIQELFSPRQIAFLFECGWVDDAGSLFRVEALEACYYQEETAGGKMEPAPLPPHNPQEGFQVDLGFDPNGGGADGDHASLVALEDRGERLRVIEHKRFGNQSIDWQVAQIKRAVTRYKARSLVIDVTGTGAQVFKLLEPWVRGLPWRCELVPLLYNIETKWALVLHVERLVAAKRLEWDGEKKEIFQSFLAIRSTTTDQGRSTIRARREKGLGHADLFWALSHAASRSPVEGSLLKDSVGTGLGLSTSNGGGSAPLTSQGGSALLNLGIACAS